MKISGIGQPADSPVSKSAMFVVTASAVVSKDPVYAKTFCDPYAGLFAAAISDEAEAALASLDDAAARAAFIAESEADMDGLVTHVLYRKTWIEGRVRDALSAGLRQVVIFGAGCDTLSLRLGAALDGIATFEIDRPETIDFRRRVLDGRAELPAGVRMVGINFESQTLGALVDAGFDPALPTVFVAEGVMEYLTMTEVDSLIEFVVKRAPAASRLVFTFLAREVYDDGSFDSVKADLDQGGEHLKFGIVPDRIDEFLAARHLRRLEMVSPAWVANDFAPRVGAPVGAIPGWHLAVAETVTPAKP